MHVPLWPRTYEIFAGSWGAMADPSTSPIAAALNSRPKYVASTSLADPQWAGPTVLPVRTSRSTWSTRGPLPGASPSRPIGLSGVRSRGLAGRADGGMVGRCARMPFTHQERELRLSSDAA